MWALQREEGEIKFMRRSKAEIIIDAKNCCNNNE
jgi:hypothetical protein